MDKLIQMLPTSTRKWIKEAMTTRQISLINRFTYFRRGKVARNMSHSSDRISCFNIKLLGRLLNDGGAGFMRAELHGCGEFPFVEVSMTTE